MNIEKTNLRYIPTNGYVETALNRNKKLRHFVYNLSVFLYATIQYLLALMATYKASFLALPLKLFFIRKIKPRLQLSAVELQAIHDLKEKGYAVVENFFSSEEMDQLTKQMEENFAQNNIFRAGYTTSNFPMLYNLTTEQLKSIGEHIIVNKPFLNVDNSLEMAMHPTILKIATGALNQIGNIGFTLGRSHVRKKYKQSSGWHRDTYSGKIVQAFIYFHDVTEFHGPLHFVEKSHKFKLKDFRVVYDFEKNLTTNDGRISDVEIQKFFKPNEIKKLTVPKGSIVFAMTTGFHKGPVWENPEDPRCKDRDYISITISQKTLLSFFRNKAVGDKNFITHDQYQKMGMLQKYFISEFNVV